jgi:hypothetical protein
MFFWLGMNRNLAANPVTWGVIALLAIATAAMARSDRNFTYTCAVMGPVVVGAVGIPEYYVGRYENITYDLCVARLPERYVKGWPLSDCRPGGRAMWSDGTLAGFPQVCRTKRGNVSIL